MTARSLALALTVLSVTFAQAAPPPPADLPSAIQQEATARELLKTQADEANAVLQKWYHSALDAVKKDAAAKADLDSVVAVENERQRVERDLTPEEKATLPKLLQTVRGQYDQGRAQRALQQKTALAASLREYMATLESIEKNSTRKLEVENALAARKERAAAAEELSALTVATIPAPAAPASIAAASPARATPAIRAASLSSGGGASAPVIQVASEIRAWGTALKPHKDAIAFECPMSPFDHMRGGRGVLLKSETGSTRKGSTWTCNYTWDGGFNGVRFVHPYGGGHVMVRLMSRGPEPVAFSGWQKQPMSAGGNPAIFKETAAGAEVYPLKTNQKYAVVSQLSPKGIYSLTIDGKVVNTGAFTTPGDLAVYTSSTPMTLPEGFTGENLPMKWKAGWAALIVGSAPENGINLCEEITFQPSAP